MKKEEIVTGKTVEEAVMSAREKFGADNNEISYEVLELPKKGFLGFGASPAKIKVIISESEDILSELKIKGELDIGHEKKQKAEKTPKTVLQPQKPQSAQRSDPQPQKPQSAQRSDPQPQKPQSAQRSDPQPQKPQSAQRSDSQPQKQGQKFSGQKQANPEAALPQQPQPKAAKPGQPKPEKKAGAQGRKPVPRGEAERGGRAIENRAMRDDSDEITLNQEELNCAVNFLETVLRHMELDGVSVVPLDISERRINLEGEGAGTLIGHHGETLDALQYLTNLHVNRKAEALEAGEKKYRREYVKVTIDIEGYRSRREDTLRELARRMAERALKYKKNIFLEPMNPYERRIIHSEIQTIEGVSTHSVGSDENRKIVITVNGLQQNRSSGRGSYNKSKNRKPISDISEGEEAEFAIPEEPEVISLED